MGYHVTQIVNVKIKKENVEEILKLVGNPHSFLFYDEVQHIKVINNIKSLFDYLEYDITEDDNFIYVNNFNGEKLGDVQEFWNLISNYVEDESEIEFIGEDGGQWILYILNKKLHIFICDCQESYSAFRKSLK